MSKPNKHKQKTICLNLIVKNERHVIQRCLDSVKHHIDYWVISDTGSTDGTQDFIRDYFAQHGIPGELVEHEWKNFGHNRTLALQAARGKADYILFMDADDHLSWDGEAGFKDLQADAYYLLIRDNNVKYANLKLVRGDLPWKWEGVLHEYVTIDDYRPQLETYTATNCLIHSTREGARNNDPEKYKKDAAILEQGLVDEPDNARYRFYLARSYQDAGKFEQAIEHYEKRIAMGGWYEEVYYAMFSIGVCKERLRHNGLSIVNAYVRSFDYRPERIEGLCAAMRCCREQGYNHLALQLAKRLKAIPQTQDILFVHHLDYIWRYEDEYSIALINCGYYQEGIAIIKHLLALETTPAEQRSRMQYNMNYAYQQLAPEERTLLNNVAA
ncbi:MAG: glycosyl transferase family 2 [Proteobacteria bacterium]|nr:MAG: glycosyl transferase family 2 [Pseudomonadota bacterium]